MSEVRPPIPVRLAQRPTTGGLVVPWINNVMADGGVDFRGTNGTRWRKAWIEGLCQTCGEPHGPLLIFFGGPNQIKPGGFFDEPATHPECGSYVIKGCPMISGRMPAYRAGHSASDGKRGGVCPDPACGCGGYVGSEQILHGDGTLTIQPAADRPPPTGEPAHAWYAVYARRYRLAVTPGGQLLGGVPVDVVKTRTISTPRQETTGD